MRTLFFLLCLFVAANAAAAAETPAPAQPPAPTVVEPSASVSGLNVTHAGIYTGQTKSALAQAGQQSPTRTVGRVSDWHFVADSTDVPGKVGTQFGMEFRIDGAPEGDAVTLHLAITFPPPGMRNPNTGDKMDATTIAFTNMKIGALCLIGYGFDNAWEIVPGEWKVQILYHDHALAERTFTVSKAD